MRIGAYQSVQGDKLKTLECLMHSLWVQPSVWLNYLKRRLRHNVNTNVAES